MKINPIHSHAWFPGVHFPLGRSRCRRFSAMVPWDVKGDAVTVVGFGTRPRYGTQV